MRLGRYLSRPRRRAVRRSPRPLRQDAGRLCARRRRRDAASSPRRCGRSTSSWCAARSPGGPRARSIPSSTPARSKSASAHLEILNKSLTPPFQPTAQGTARRGPAAEVSLPRPAPAGDAADAAAAASHDQDRCATTSTSSGSSKSRRRCSAAARRKGPAITSCPAACSTGTFLRPAAVAAALQADSDGGRLRPLYPGRPLLPRRGPAGRPAAGVHAVGPGNVVRHRRRHHRRDRRPGGPAGQGDPRHRR